MRLAFVADGHSPIARSWIEHFISSGHEVHLISTYPCEADSRLASLTVVPVALSGMAEQADGASTRGARLRWLRSAGGLGLRVILRQWLGPLTLPGAGERVCAILTRIQPDLVHALRVPFEGMLAAAANPPAPLLCSTWGNDFTFHARSTPAMAAATRRAMRRLDALHSDCARDLRLGTEWGFRAGRPTIVLPGNGGVRREVFHPLSGSSEPMPDEAGRRLASLSADVPVVVNPRGFRAYVRQDTFFRAVPLILRRHPQVRFVCLAMQGEAKAAAWARKLGVEDAVVLVPSLDPPAMAAVFRRAQVSVSLGVHDGTPNTLLETMACGCFPVTGDLESIREWITPGTNGLLVDPADADSVAAGVCRAIGDSALRRAAQAANQDLIAARAEYRACMQRAEAFYHTLLAPA